MASELRVHVAIDGEIDAVDMARSGRSPDRGTASKVSEPSPYLDRIVTSAHSPVPNVAAEEWKRLLIQPISIPRLGHTGVSTSFGDAAAANNLLRPDGGNTKKLKELIRDSVSQTTQPYEGRNLMRKRDLEWSRKAKYELAESMKEPLSDLSSLSSNNYSGANSVDLSSSAVTTASAAFQDVNMKVRAQAADEKREMIGSNISSSTSPGKRRGKKSTRGRRNHKERRVNPVARVGGSNAMRFEAILNTIYGGSPKHK